MSWQITYGARRLARLRRLWRRAGQNPLVARIASKILRFEEVIWWGAALGAAAGILLIADQTNVIARDWREFYRPAALAPDFLSATGIASPPYALFLFKPLSWLPLSAGFAALLLIYLLCFRMAARLAPANKWLIFPSFPALWMLVYGQLDALVLLGVALGWWAIREKRPYWQGAATLLLLLKPHVGAPLAVVYLWWQKDWRALLVSASAGLVSLGLFGFWPLPWLRTLFAEAGAAAGGGGFAGELNEWNDISLFPYGLAFWTLLLLPYPRVAKAPAIISASLLSAPYAGGYSLLAVLAFPLPAITYPILSLPLVTQRGYDWLVLAPILLILNPAVAYLWRIRPGSWRRRSRNEGRVS